MPPKPSARGPDPDDSLRYAAHPDGVIDLHLPGEAAAAEATLVVLLHGGFWKQRYDRTHTRPLARALARAGHPVATPEYRRVGGAGGWPTTGQDVLAALDALPGLLAERGLRWRRCVGVGHSAGGHLLLWAGSRRTVLRLDRAVALGGVVDLAEARRRNLGAGAVDALLGDAPIEQADPMTLVEEDSAPEVVLVHGRQDEEVPVELSRRFVARHPWARLVELPGVGHYEFLRPGSPAWLPMLEAIGQTGLR